MQKHIKILEIEMNLAAVYFLLHFSGEYFFRYLTGPESGQVTKKQR